MSESSKAKGDLLERVVTRLCSGIQNAVTEHNVTVVGKSGLPRQIDTLISGKLGAFGVKIVVDSKNHRTPVDINEVESMAGMVADIGANLGVIVCPAGFTDGAKRRADVAGIQLYRIFDHALGNTNLFIRVRYIEARIDQFAFRIMHVANGPFEMSTDSARWIFQIDGKTLRGREVAYHLWNSDRIEQKPGEQTVEVGAVKMTDAVDAAYAQYCELAVIVVVVEDHFLKLFPASMLQNAADGSKHLGLGVDIYSTGEDMLRNGWVAADPSSGTDPSIHSTTDGEIQEWVMRGVYSFRDDSAAGEAAETAD